MIESAIKQLNSEIDELILAKPKEGDQDWYVLQAKSIGLSMLRAAFSKGYTTPFALESYRQSIRKKFVELV